MARTPKKAQPAKDADATIYMLSCPETRELRYIGQTRQLRRRQWNYRTLSCNEGNRPVSCWVRSLLVRGLEPVFTVIETTNSPDEREAFAIKTARENGFRVLNIADGGQENGHMIRAKEATIGTRGRTHSGMVLSEFVKHYGPCHPKTIRLREAIARGAQRFGRKEFNRRVDERHEQRIAARMTCHD